MQIHVFPYTALPIRFRIQQRCSFRDLAVIRSRQGTIRASNDVEETLKLPLSEAIATDDISGDGTIGEKLERYRRRSQMAQNRARREVKSDNQSDNWDGDQYIGSNWNILTVLLLVSILTPITGLAFAYLSYGTLWGQGTQAI